MTDVLALLVAELGDAVSTDVATLAAARADRSGHESAAAPLAVVRATSPGQVQAALRIAHEHRLPVVPRGAGTGLAGGAIGSAGELVVDVSGMDRLLELDAANELAVVEPGMLNGELNRLAGEHGLWFTPDPASRAISSVGGNIATNAGGLLCAKYGVTRESVLGLAVVLADGSLMRFGHRTVKGVTGLDLVSLLVGSEGTLGIIVEATVRLRPLPPGQAVTIGAWFSSVEAAAAASASLTAARLRPAAMELLDEPALSAIGDHLSMDLAGRGALLVVQTDGAAARDEATNALRLLHAAGGDAAATVDPAEGERLLHIRRSFHGAMAARGSVLIEDVAVPRSALPAMFAAIADIGARHGLVIPTVAHAGDGNLHPNFVFEGPEVPPAIWRAADELFLACLELGGTLTGEHGVGMLKQRWLGQELGGAQRELQRRIKAAFDPHGILNPGKAI